MTPALELARRYLGTRELPGAAHSHHVQAWLEECGLPHGSADEVPWCGAFVRHVAWLSAVDIPTLPARARSWLTVGQPVDLDDALPGWDLVVLSRGGPGQPGPEVLDAPGHVGFFAGTRILKAEVLILGGNQWNAVSVQAYPAARVLGIRRLEP